MKSNMRLESVLQTLTHAASHSDGCAVVTKCLLCVSKVPLPPPVASPNTHQSRHRSVTGKRFRELKAETEEFQDSCDV